MAQPGRRRSDARRAPARPPRRAPVDKDVLSMLARVAREVQTAVERGRITPAVRTKFHAVALLLREERAQVRDEAMGQARRVEQLKRLDGIATMLARTAVRDPRLLSLLDEESKPTAETRLLMAELLAPLGIERATEPPPATEPSATSPATERRVVPQSVVARQLANPFLPPDYSAVRPAPTGPRRLGGWELLQPLLTAFERADSGAPACMALPEPGPIRLPEGRELMRHQAQVVEAAAEGHRTFLLADEPGLGKTAQSLLAAQAAGAYPLLAVVPSVVKTNWAREAQMWTPQRKVTVVHGNGEKVDGFADIVVVNYDVLDRHVGWLGDFGFRGMIVDEAHFIKNKSSQRSQHVLELSERIRFRTARPLLMALTGTPLINDIEDFLAIWQFLGWIDGSEPRAELLDRLEETGLIPTDPGFPRAARQAVIDMGIVRRRKIDVAADIPARRTADLPVELDDRAGRSIRAAERELARRLVARYHSVLRARGEEVVGIDHALVDQVATWEQKEASGEAGENVFGLMRRIGQAKAGLAADYALQLARSAGKVVFFAKHVDVMDVAEETFTRNGIKFASIRGGQTPRVRQRNIDAFTDERDVAIAVCSLTAAGVGLNLQVASNLVLAELSWTDAEQTQAIDRSHRIGQTEPVTAWRIIAAQTIDSRIAALIDSKAGLAARALDGSDEETFASADVQHEALVALLTEELTREQSALDDAD
ncbi:MAG: DEAD/DEAH box helicase [Jatrophihabitans sp.]|uniref:DEAD/DEAH box helicase n=1 Tax=Jatrophihabitans sp. TaxID=1932789 RepID=UPI003F7FA546